MQDINLKLQFFSEIILDVILLIISIKHELIILIFDELAIIKIKLFFKDPIK